MVDEYPRKDLPFVCSRRNFFGALINEIVITAKTARGGQSFRLSNLGSLPDDQLAKITPIMNPAYEIYVEEEYLWTRNKQTGKTYQEFLLNEENRRTFNLFNGRNTLGEIARQLSRDLAWEEDFAFAQARGIFLSLADHTVCLPTNSLEDVDNVSASADA